MVILRHSCTQSFIIFHDEPCWNLSPPVTEGVLFVSTCTTTVDSGRTSSGVQRLPPLLEKSGHDCRRSMKTGIAASARTSVSLGGAPKHRRGRGSIERLPSLYSTDPRDCVSLLPLSLELFSPPPPLAKVTHTHLAQQAQNLPLMRLESFGSPVYCGPDPS
jgi:hypothetical protein